MDAVVNLKFALNKLHLKDTQYDASHCYWSSNTDGALKQEYNNEFLALQAERYWEGVFQLWLQARLAPKVKQELSSGAGG